VPFKGRVIFEQYIAERHRFLSLNLYKLFSISGYTCTYKGLAESSADKAVTHAEVRSLMKGLVINFTRTDFSALLVYLMIHTQELSPVVKLKRNARGEVG
jgi:hypothetical protein